MRTALDTPEDPPGKVKIMFYQMERATRMANVNNFGDDGLVWLVDCTDFSLRISGEVTTAKEIIDAVSSHYPERLGLLLLYNAPWIFGFFWKLCVPFVASTTIKKVVFISKSEKEKFLDYISEVKKEKRFYFNFIKFIFFRII